MGDWRSRGRIVSRTKCLPRPSLYSVFRLTAFLWVKLVLTRIVPPVAVKILIPKSVSEYRTSSLMEVAQTCSQTSIKFSSCWTFNTLLPYLGPRAASLILPCLFQLEIVLTLTWRISATSNLDLPFASKEKARSGMHWALMLRTADRTTGQMPRTDFSNGPNCHVGLHNFELRALAQRDFWSLVRTYTTCLASFPCRKPHKSFAYRPCRKEAHLTGDIFCLPIRLPKALHSFLFMAALVWVPRPRCHC